MAKPELGTKRICPQTGRKFYDLGKTPVISPYTGEVVPIAPIPVSRARAETAARAPLVPRGRGPEVPGRLALDPLRRKAAVVDADIRMGNDAGVNGTPAFFINGRMISGAQPFEVFQKIIDEELQRK